MPGVTGELILKDPGNRWLPRDALRTGKIINHDDEGS